MTLGCEAIGLLHPDNIKCDEGGKQLKRDIMSPDRNLRHNLFVLTEL